MKKLLLSFLVVGSFVGYSYHEQTEKPDVVPLTTSSSPTGIQKPNGIQTGPSVTPSQQSGAYKDGEYTGPVVDAFYGNIQVKAIVQNGKLSDIQFLQYPNDRETSRTINEQMMPIIREEAISAQSADVDIVSGATDSAEAFRKSLGEALKEAAI